MTDLEVPQHYRTYFCHFNAYLPTEAKNWINTVRKSDFNETRTGVAVCNQKCLSSKIINLSFSIKEILRFLSHTLIQNKVQNV